MMKLSLGVGILVVAANGCGSDGASRDSGSGGITATDTATGGDTLDGSGTATSGNDTAETGGPCPAPRDCGNVCCDANQACVDGACVVDCGGDVPCADQCCGGGEICYVGQCVVPGGACSMNACATRSDSECEPDEICDSQMGVCVPNFANPACAFEPKVGVFDPVPRFTWGLRAQRACDLGCQKEEVCNAATSLCEPTWNHVDVAADDSPAWHQVLTSPMVGDLDGDCIPEIVFSSYRNSEYTEDGILRVIRGDSGEKVWTLADPTYRTDPASHPAIGDLDDDGRPEIIVPGTGSNLIAVGGDGTPLWISDPYTFGGRSGSPAIANFDGSGAPEIAYGRAVWDFEGNLLFEGVGAAGTSGNFGPLPCVADLDADGRPELIAGATAWTFTGTVGVDFAGSLLWEGDPPNGFCGVADFDLDGQPEVATVAANQISIFNGQTGTRLAQITIPGGGAGGPPNIADFDGDGIPDLGTAGGEAYVVVQFDGTATLTQLWEAPTKDGSSQRTGSSVFDFDGDGRSEVIYADEWYLRIYPGTEPDCPGGPGCDGVMTDAEVLFIDINSSRTRTEIPIIADVDGDFKAEIIVSTNNESNQGAIGDAGVEVFEDRLDNWVSTLPIWNQHTYHVTNVEPDGSIPVSEPPNWSTPAASPYNSYRRNTQGEIEQLCAPDLVPGDLMVDAALCPDLDISAKVINQGCLGVGPGVNVAFYDDGALLGVVQTEVAIPAGGSTTVRLELANPGSPPFTIHVVVDDDGNGNGALNECLEDNNASEPAQFCNPIG